MSTHLSLIGIELGKLFRLASLRFSLVVLALFPLVWSYAPGVFEVYGVYVVSAYQVAALTLLSSMEFMLPLLVAIASAELLGMEISLRTLATVLLRPVSRAQWLTAKLIAVVVYPFLLLLFALALSLLLAFPLGYGDFVGGTGLGRGGLLGDGVMAPDEALVELARAYGLAALSLMPISVLALLFTVIFMNAAAGALATLASLIIMQLLVVFPGLERFLLTTQLSAYVEPVHELSWVVSLLVMYSALFATLSVFLFERRDF
jgi:ABC-2 type transport system permease protein